MKSTKEKGVFTQVLDNGYRVKIDFNFFKIFVYPPHPDQGPIKYDLDRSTPLYIVTEIINGVKKLA